MSMEKSQDPVYEYVETELRGEMESQERRWDAEDARRGRLLHAFRDRQQKRLELQRRSGQMVTATSLYIASQPPSILGELPRTTRRALRSGELAPHGSHCCVSSHRHGVCYIPQRVLQDALAVTKKEVAQPAGVEKRSGKLTYLRRRAEALDYFKQLAAVQEQPTPEPAEWQGVHGLAENKGRRGISLRDVAGEDVLRREALAALAARRFTPEELRLLVDQERADGLGARLLEMRLFTTPEGLSLPEYSGRLEPVGEPPGPPGTTAGERPAIQAASLGQMLAAAQVAAALDVDGLRGVSRAPEALGRAKAGKAKAVSFAPEKELHRLPYRDEPSDAEPGDPGDPGRGGSEESERGFDSEPPGARGAEDIGAESRREIDWFLRAHRLE